MVIEISCLQSGACAPLWVCKDVEVWEEKLFVQLMK